MTPHIRDLETKLEALKQELASARQQADPQPVSDYTFKTSTGDTSLLQLFGDKQELLVIHNMGKSCNYCTMWADVLHGQLRHIERRAGIVVCSPDAPEVQQEHAKNRGWTIKMVSDRGGDFTTDMGFKTEKEGYWPGVSAFHKNEDDSVSRTGTAIFGPGDDFCPPWHFFDLLTGGSKDWEPD